MDYVLGINDSIIDKFLFFGTSVTNSWSSAVDFY